MDSNQLRALCHTDPVLKTIPTAIIFEKDLPTILNTNWIYFVLISNGKTILKSHKRVWLGHWILIDSLISKTNPQISFFDPYGKPPSLLTLTKLEKTCSKKSFSLFINKIQVQDNISTTCGPVIGYCALLRARNFTYKQILKHKVSKNVLMNAKIIPNIISSLLPKKLRTISRFSLDFL